MGVAAWAVASCKTVDSSLLHAPDEVAVPDAGKDAAIPLDGRVLPAPDAGHQIVGEPCTAKKETCNGKDDDCDDKVDEGGDALCAAHVIMHAPAVCEPMGGKAVCFKVGACDKGYVNCDGDPANGCEPACDCQVCDDAGTDDAGP